MFGLAESLDSTVSRFLAQLSSRIQTQKGSNERLFILTQSMQIFGEIPFVKPQNDT